MKKLIAPFTIAILCAILVVGSALAAEDTPQGRGQNIYGVVIAIADDSFTLQNQDGKLFTYFVDDSTNFRSPEIEAPDFANLELGGKIAVFAPGSDEAYPAARLVILLPEDFDPSQWAEARTRGEVVSVDIEAGSFTLQANSGEEKSFWVDDSTRFFGQLSSLNDLQVGMSVGVGGVEAEDGEVLARLIVGANTQEAKLHAGTIMVVTPAAGTFTLETRQGDDLIIAVDENTIFNSRAGEIESLNDLTVDMVAMVYGSSQDDGVFLATRLVAGDTDDLPNYDVKAIGQVTEVGVDSVSLQPRNGEEMTFLVDEETTFRSRGNELTSLGDFEEGSFALVGAYETDDGQLLAKLIFVRAAQSP